MRRILMAAVFVWLFLAGSYGWAASGGQDQMTISGRISDVDRAGKIIAVRFVNPQSQGADEIMIKVTDDTVITSGTKQKSLYNIQQFDPVSVTYYDDGLSGLKALRISDLNQPNC